MIRILICGGREFSDRTLLEQALEAYKGAVVIHGAARGADTLAEEWALKHGKGVHRFPANWQRDGKAAGPIRNQAMLDKGRPDMVIAFPGGRGTADMVRRAKAAGLKVIEVPHE